MDKEKRFPLGVVVISVVMFFVALGTDIYWLLKLVGRPVADTLPIGPEAYTAFVFPDIMLSLLLFAGVYGLMRLRKFGFVVTLVALGMWLSDLLFTFGLTKWDRIGFVGPCLFFIFFATGYLWIERNLFK
jgi:hypothetical protein